MKWENAQLYGGLPTPRYTHTMNLYKEDKIVVVGGFAGGIGVLNETAVIKMTSRRRKFCKDFRNVLLIIL